MVSRGDRRILAVDAVDPRRSAERGVEFRRAAGLWPERRTPLVAAASFRCRASTRATQAASARGKASRSRSGCRLPDELAVADITWFELAWLAGQERIVLTIPIATWLERLAADVRTIRRHRRSP